MSDVICDIIAGRLEAEVVWRDDRVIAFLDHRPVFKGHVLLAPLEHVATLTDAPAELIAPLFLQVQRVADAVVTGLGADGSFTAVNTIVSQSVPHLHVHVVPRRRKDGLRGFFWPRTKYADGEAARYGELLRAALAGSA